MLTSEQWEALKQRLAATMATPSWVAQGQRYASDIAELTTEVEALRAEVERCHAGMRDRLAAFEHDEQIVGVLQGNAQAIADLAEARLRNFPLDPKWVEHDLREIARLAKGRP